MVLSAALELMKVSARREASTEAEILLTMGKHANMQSEQQCPRFSSLICTSFLTSSVVYLISDKEASKLSSEKALFTIARSVLNSFISLV